MITDVASVILRVLCRYVVISFEESRGDLGARQNNRQLDAILRLFRMNVSW